MSPIPGFGQHDPDREALNRITEMLNQLTENTEKIMSQQSDIDAATQAILGLVTNINTEDGNLSTAVSAIQAFIAAQPAGADTSALDAAVAQISGAQSNLGTAVAAVQGVVPAVPAPPAPPAA